MKSHGEMAQVFKDSPAVLSRTLALPNAQSEAGKSGSSFPHFEVPAGFTLDSYFERVTREGYARHLEVFREQETPGRLKHCLAEYEQRLTREPRSSSR